MKDGRFWLFRGGKSRHHRTSCLAEGSGGGGQTAVKESATEKDRLFGGKGERAGQEPTVCVRNGAGKENPNWCKTK